MVDFICKAIQGQRSPGSWCLFSKGCRSVWAPYMRRDLCKLHATVAEYLTYLATYKRTLHFAALQECLIKEVCCPGQEAEGKEGEWEWGVWRGKEGIRVPLFPLNTDQWSENLFLCAFLRIPNSQHSPLGRGVLWRVGWGVAEGSGPSLELNGQTVKIQILMGPLTLRDTETLGLSRLDT